MVIIPQTYLQRRDKIVSPSSFILASNDAILADKSCIGDK